MNYYTKVIKTKENSLKRLTDSFPPVCIQYLASKAQTKNINTVESYAEALGTFLHYLQGREHFNGIPLKSVQSDAFSNISRQDILNYLEFLKNYQNRNGKPRNNGYTSRRHKLAVIKGFFSFLKKEGFITTDPAKNIIAAEVLNDQTRAKKYGNREDSETNKRIMALALDDSLFKETKRKDIHDKVAYRDYIVMDLYSSYGLCAYEISGLDLSDLDLNSNTIAVTDYRGNRRTQKLNPDLASMLTDYLSDDPDKTGTRKGLHPADGENALFISREKGRISPRSVLNTYNKYKKLLAERSNSDDKRHSKDHGSIPEEKE